MKTFETITKEEIEAGFINAEMRDFEDHINYLLDHDPINEELKEDQEFLASLQED